MILFFLWSLHKQILKLFKWCYLQHDKILLIKCDICVQASKFNMDNSNFHFFCSIFKKIVKINGNDFLFNENSKNEKNLVCKMWIFTCMWNS
jgi:hypothetical protein